MKHNGSIDPYFIHQVSKFIFPLLLFEYLEF